MGKEKKTILAVYIASFFSLLNYLPSTLLGNLYNWFSEIDQSIVVLLFTAPSLISTVCSMVLGGFLHRANKKIMLLAGLSANLLGGAIILITAGQSFPLALVGMGLSGLAFALLMTTGNAVLSEVCAPDKVAASMGINLAIGTAGSMVFSPLAGFLAADGNWVRAYWLFLAIIPAILLVFALYSCEAKNAQNEYDATGKGLAQIPKEATIKYAKLIIPEFLYLVGIQVWALNTSDYVINQAGIGSSAEAGIMSTLSSVGGLLGGALLVPIIRKLFGGNAVPVGMLVYAACISTLALGTHSILLLYICSLLSMLFHQPTYSIAMSVAGKVLPGGLGIGIFTGALGAAGFLATYILNGIASLFGGAYNTRFWVGVVLICVAALLLWPQMRRYEKEIE